MSALEKTICKAPPIRGTDNTGFLLHTLQQLTAPLETGFSDERETRSVWLPACEGPSFLGLLSISHPPRWTVCTGAVGVALSVKMHQAYCNCKNIFKHNLHILCALVQYSDPRKSFTFFGLVAHYCLFSIACFLCCSLLSFPFSRPQNNNNNSNNNTSCEPQVNASTGPSTQR